MTDRTCRHPEGCGSSEIFSDDMCQKHYMREYRARKRNGEGARTYRGLEVDCRREECPEKVRVTGKRRRACEEKGIHPYHSRECQKLDTVAVTCEGCGVQGKKYRSEVARNTTGRFFLHPECMYEVGAKPRRGKTHTCEQCGKSFYRRPGDTTARFDTRECRAEFEKAQQVTITCEGCGKDFQVIPAVAKRGTRRFHDKACWSLAQITNRVPGQWHNGKPKRYTNEGYVLIFQPDHPHAGRYGWIAEHRWVMEQAVGYHLTSDQEVNHINENKSDNRPRNLEILDKASHTRVTAASIWRRRKDKDAELEEYRRRFGPLIEVKTS